MFLKVHSKPLGNVKNHLELIHLTSTPQQLLSLSFTQTAETYSSATPHQTPKPAHLPTSPLPPWLSVSTSTCSMSLSSSTDELATLDDEADNRLPV